MSSDKRIRKPNEFNGMSLEQLQHKADICKMMIDNAKREIKRHQKEIEKQESIVKDYTNALRRIETAKNKVGDIEYITILVVWVKTVRVWKYPDKPFRGYYSVSDWKSLLIYNFAVNKVNKNDYNKAGSCLYNSSTDENTPIFDNTDLSNQPQRGFRSNQKKELQQAILRAIKAFTVVDVVFETDVNIAKTEIEKAIHKPVICKSNNNDRY